MGIRKLQSESELIYFVNTYNRMAKHGNYNLSDLRSMDVYIYYSKDQAVGGYAVNQNKPIGILSDIPMELRHKSEIDLYSKKVTETRAIWISNRATEMHRTIIYCWSVFHAALTNSDYIVGAVLNRKHLRTQERAYYRLLWSGVSKPFGEPINVWVIYGRPWIVLLRLPYAVFISAIERFFRKLVKTYHRKKRMFK